ncbi:Arm DNA-binding domain-containing protein [Novosphingobium sp. BL-8A]|uniref:Arm DNA-binding domain-containing protein n=1 Tax=Novosphingobium sp. BL-8A TaxID=3127639 RepID=UPI003757E424
MANANPKEKPFKLTDSRGPYLFVAKSALKSWRMKFEFESREKLPTFGSYPELTLKDARNKRDEARMAEGEAPTDLRAFAERLERLESGLMDLDS